jgi:2-(1,2-epoxy-1,2-dihydrophenyl)acetyl-CoA isomerase
VAYETILYEKETASPPSRSTARRPSTPLFPDEPGSAEVFKEASVIRSPLFVITGAGRAFCAGQDLKGRTPDQKGSLGASLREKYNPMIRQIRGMEKIVIAAVNGSPPARVAIWLSPVTCGSLPKRQSSFSRLCALVWRRTRAVVLSCRVVGLSKAMELLLLGETVDAREAQRIGLIAKVFPAAEFARSTKEIAARVACAPRGYRPHQTGLESRDSTRPEADLEYEAHLQEIAGRSSDYDEGSARFGKARPVFTGSKMGKSGFGFQVEIRKHETDCHSSSNH